MVSPIAETTTTTSWPCLRVRMTRSATCLQLLDIGDAAAAVFLNDHGHDGESTLTRGFHSNLPRDLAISDHELMHAALVEARKAMASDEVPIGAVVAIDEEIVAAAFNQPISTVDPTAHAEIRALRAAAQKIGNYRLTGATLCVTVEPCAMCVGAMVHARIGTLIYGAPEPKTGAVRSTMKLIDDPSWNHRIMVVAGLMAEECRELLQNFFNEKRKRKNE